MNVRDGRGGWTGGDGRAGVGREIEAGSPKSEGRAATGADDGGGGAEGEGPV